jgi:hypothetical protein
LFVVFYYFNNNNYIYADVYYLKTYKYKLNGKY